MPLHVNGFYREAPRNSDASADLVPTELQVVFRCPRPECERLFIAYYEASRQALDANVQSGFLSYWKFLRSAPIESGPVRFDSAVEALSPYFVKIFNQAHQAELSGLDQVCGPGYRKALEFLIKDYAVNRAPERAGDIRSALLGPVIREYVSDANLKACAERATWLGNDETHYIRKWEGRDVEDLKKLINATAHWIAMEELMKEFLGSMPDGKKGTTA